LADIPIIFISALTNAEDKVQAFTAGGVDYVSKPFQAEEVDARIATHLALRRQRRQLQEDNEQLRTLEALRDNLVHMIVHDMRTPLTAIHGFLQTIDNLESKQMSADGLEFVHRSLEATTELIEMISSLLDVSKMEAGALTRHPELFDMMTVMHAVVAELSSLQDDRKVLVSETPAPLNLRADRELLRRILRNLLSNALKYTPSSGSVYLGAEERGEQIYVSVHDSGPGIPLEYHEKIFEKFGQVDLRAHERKYSTGLGLTFCKLAVEAHGGSIGVESSEGNGSLFWFTLPKDGPAV
jgi:signal transduction histidine kinase